MQFVWDTEKEKINQKKHNITFTEACYVFSDKFMLTIFDEEHSEDEDRWISIGQIPNGKILLVVHTFREINEIEKVRIISARKTSNNEKKQYLNRKGKT